MNIVKHAFWLFVSLGCLGTACNGGSDSAANALDRVEPYRSKCIETLCSQQQKQCTARASQRCDECFDHCTSPSQTDFSLCASICDSVCESNCSSCSYSNDECAKQGVVLQPPPINPEIALETQRYVALCIPDWPAEIAMQYWARSFRHEFVDVLRCELEHGCGSTNECPLQEWEMTEGTVGTAICQRQQQCNSACSDDVHAHVDNIEFLLRPDLAAELWRCAGETDCAIAKACWAALQPAVGIGSYPDAKSSGS